MLVVSIILLFALISTTNAVVAENGEYPPSQMIWADPYHNAINAWGWEEGEKITIQILDPGGVDVTPEDSIRIYDVDGASWNSEELGIDLFGGFSIGMTGDISGVNKTLIMSPLEVLAYDFYQIKISGVYDPGLPIQIYLAGSAPFEFTTEGELWEATFSELQYGAGGEVWQTDEDGDMTGIGMWVPSPRLTVSITDDWFRGEDFPREDFVMVTIYDSLTGSVLWQQERETDENGFLFVGGWEFELDLKPEMVVEVDHSLVTKSIELEPITMYVVDEEYEYLAGKAPPNRDVWVGAGNEFDGCGMTVTSNSDGFWEADFLNQLPPCYITPDMWKAAQVFDSDWDATEANPGFPRGSHDYDTGDVPNWACNVGGWVVDPDDQSREVQIRFYADDEFKYEASTTGHGFEEHFWELISSYETHIMLVEAFDVESAAWYPLENSPGELTCRTQDIYSFDPETGVTTQVTDLRDTNEFNPSWSPSGKQVAYDVVTLWDTQIGINITNLKTGQTDPLAGAEGGNDAIWSPNGKSIVFDRLEGEIFFLYMVPSTGGKAQLLRQDATSADFSPNGKRLVFQQSSDGSLRTMPMDKKGKETVVAEFGANPSWSFNGNWIAYELDGDIWKVQVDSNGNPKGDSIQVTSGPLMDGQPTWSADSQNIIYHTGLSRDYDLWTVSADGGIPVWLTGASEFGDYDPTVNKANSFVAYSSFSPNGQASRLWIAAFTYDLEPGYWEEGDHYYSYWLSGEPYPDNLIHFTSSFNAPIYEGTVLLRGDGLRARDGEDLIYIDTIHPSQVTQFHVGWRAEGSYAEALDVYTIIMAQVSWDGPDPIDLVYNEIFPFSSEVNWEDYLYSFTW
jgi:hypothetical protein